MLVAIGLLFLVEYSREKLTYEDRQKHIHTFDVVPQSFRIMLPHLHTRKAGDNIAIQCGALLNAITTELLSKKRAHTYYTHNCTISRRHRIFGRLPLLFLFAEALARRACPGGSHTHTHTRLAYTINVNMCPRSIMRTLKKGVGTVRRVARINPMPANAANTQFTVWNNPFLQRIKKLIKCMTLYYG